MEDETLLKKKIHLSLKATKRAFYCLLAYKVLPFLNEIPYTVMVQAKIVKSQ
jgi:hypothetical protein